MQSKLSHHLLWERLRISDKDAFFDLYKELYYPLVNFGIRVCADADISSEATDQVFTTIWEKHESLSRVDNVEAYLRTFLKRKLLRIMERKRKINDALFNAGAEGDWMEMSYEEFIVKVQSDELVRHQLKTALEKLTIRQKQLIHLKFFDGLSYEQIAEQTNQTIKTAYNTIYDALKILRKELNA
jgi:RNA polymerase sigma-70 factor (ECF subfamily)